MPMRQAVHGGLLWVLQLVLLMDAEGSETSQFYLLARSNSHWWDHAKLIAERQGGYLATIKSTQERDWFMQTVANDPGYNVNGRWWVGASDRGRERHWEWVTGPDDPQTFWKGGRASGDAWALDQDPLKDDKQYRTLDVTVADLAEANAVCGDIGMKLASLAEATGLYACDAVLTGARDRYLTDAYRNVALNQWETRDGDRIAMSDPAYSYDDPDDATRWETGEPTGTERFLVVQKPSCKLADVEGYFTGQANAGLMGVLCESNGYEAFIASTCVSMDGDLLVDHVGTAAECRAKCVELGPTCSGFIRTDTSSGATTLKQHQDATGTCTFRRGTLSDPQAYTAEPRTCYVRHADWAPWTRGAWYPDRPRTDRDDGTLWCPAAHPYAYQLGLECCDTRPTEFGPLEVTSVNRSGYGYATCPGSSTACTKVHSRTSYDTYGEIDCRATNDCALWYNTRQVLLDMRCRYSSYSGAIEFDQMSTFGLSSSRPQYLSLAQQSSGPHAIDTRGSAEFDWRFFFRVDSTSDGLDLRLQVTTNLPASTEVHCHHTGLTGTDVGCKRAGNYEQILVQHRSVSVDYDRIRQTTKYLWAQMVLMPEGGAVSAMQFFHTKDVGAEWDGGGGFTMGIYSTCTDTECGPQYLLAQTALITTAPARPGWHSYPLVNAPVVLAPGRYFVVLKSDMEELRLTRARGGLSGTSILWYLSAQEGNTLTPDLTGYQQCCGSANWNHGGTRTLAISITYDCPEAFPTDGVYTFNKIPVGSQPSSAINDYFCTVHGTVSGDPSGLELTATASLEYDMLVLPHAETDSLPNHLGTKPFFVDLSLEANLDAKVLVVTVQKAAMSSVTCDGLGNRWDYTAYGDNSVCGIRHGSTACNQRSTWQGAKDACAAEGLRLCTQTEINDYSHGPSCDDTRLWTSTVCDSTDASGAFQGHYVAESWWRSFKSRRFYDTDTWRVCTQDYDDTATVKCCADADVTIDFYLQPGTPLDLGDLASASIVDAGNPGSSRRVLSLARPSAIAYYGAVQFATSYDFGARLEPIVPLTSVSAAVISTCDVAYLSFSPPYGIKAGFMANFTFTKTSAGPLDVALYHLVNSVADSITSAASTTIVSFPYMYTHTFYSNYETLFLTLKVPGCVELSVSSTVSPPHIDSLGFQPMFGRPSTGYPLTIEGEFFAPASTVTVGGSPCINVVVGSSGEQIYCDAPPGEGTDNAVVIASPPGVADASFCCALYDPPSFTVSSTPPSTAGSQNPTDALLHLIGTNFGRSTVPDRYAKVSVDGVDFPVILSLSDHQNIYTQVPAGQGFDLSINVTVVSQSTQDDLFSYALPSVASLLPNSGETESAGVIVITGDSFGFDPLSSGLTAHVDGRECLSVAIRALHTQLECTVPPGRSSGTVAVTVEILSRASVVSGSFTYLPHTFTSASQTSAPDPNVFPTLGAPDGTHEVSVFGSNFGDTQGTRTLQLLSDGAAGAPDTLTVSTWSHTQLTFVLPAGQGGAQLFISSAPSIKTTFHYDVPVIWDVLHTGADVEINATNLGVLLERDSDYSSVSISVNGGDCPVLGIAPLRCTLPSGFGAGRPVVATVGGRVSLPYSFNYPTPSITSISSNTTAPAEGSIDITLIGKNMGVDPDLYSGEVLVGGEVCSVIPSQWTHSKIICSLPAGTGRVPVSVSIDGLVGVCPDLFWYAAARVDTLTWQLTEVSTRGGTLRLDGQHFGTVVSDAVVTFTKNGEADRDCAVSSLSDTVLLCIIAVGAGQDWSLSMEVSSQEALITASVVPFAYPPPRVSSANPALSTTVDVNVTLFGDNLGGDETRVVVSIGGVQCTVVSAAHETMVCSLPNGAGADLVASVSVAGQNSTSAPVFGFSPPIISGAECDGNGQSVLDASSSFLVAQLCDGDVGGSLVVTGQNFGPPCVGAACAARIQVEVAAVACDNVQVVSATELRCDYAPRAAGGYALELSVDVQQQVVKESAFSYAGPRIFADSIEVLVGTHTINSGGAGRNITMQESPAGVSFRLHGSAFGASGATVTFGPVDNPALFDCPVSVSDPSTIECTTAQRMGGQRLVFQVTTSTGSVSLPSADLLSFPPPELIQWNGLSNGTYTSDTALGGPLVLVMRHVGLDFGSIAIDYDNRQYICKVTSAAVDSADTEQSLVSCDAPPGVGGAYDVVVTTLGYVVTGPLKFSYPVSPILESVAGCSPDPLDSSRTTDCPTDGTDNVRLILSGEFRITAGLSNVKVFVAREPCTGLHTNDTVGYKHLFCFVPPGVGRGVDVTVEVGTETSLPLPFLDYARPIITGVTGCVGQATRCARDGVDFITITGAYFGASSASVIVGGSVCSAVSHDGPGLVKANTAITCLLPSGEGSSKGVLVFQDGGGLSVNSGVVSYQPCPIGTYKAADGLTTCLDCQPGKFAASEGQATCTPCAAGEYASGNGSDHCEPCQAGRFSSSSSGSLGADQCSNCTVGKFAQVPGQDDCAECAPGRFAEWEGMQQCEACLKGRAAADPASQSCALCAVGRYANSEGFKACKFCNPGTSANDTGAWTCDLCTKGTFASGLETVDCDPCPAGRAAGSRGQSICPGCVPGRYANDSGLETCASCPAGKAQILPLESSCSNCALGYFQDVQGQPTCKICPAGQHCPSATGTVDPVPCPNGTSSGAGQRLCLPCAKGWHAPREGMSACMECDVGRHAPQERASSCILCPGGYFQSDSGQSTCEPCPPGTAVGERGQRVCEACPPGFASPSNATTCTVCPLGTSTKSLPRASVCTPCDKGKYAAQEGQAVCTPCDAGFFANASNAHTCRECPEGFFQRGTGASTCAKCSPGFYASSPRSVVCLACEKGRASGQEGGRVCGLCEAGKHAESTASTACDPCQPGRYGPAEGLAVCLGCLPGHYRATGEGQSCTQCEAGKAQAAPEQLTCAECRPHTYMSTQGEESCLQCAAGKDAVGTGSHNCTDCVPGRFRKDGGACQLCPEGFYQDSPGQTDCKPCPTGFAADQRGLPTCSPCQPGSYSTTSEAGSITCANCSAGSFTQSERSGECSQCDYGFFQPDEGQPACVPAPAGFFVSQEGAIDALACIPGEYNENAGQSSCLQCRPGRVAPFNASTQCTLCLEGRAQPAGGMLECEACSPGSAQSAVGQLECIACGPGSFTNATGSSNCTQCPTGRAQPDPRTRACLICPAGTFSPRGAEECTACAGQSASNRPESAFCAPCPDNGGADEEKKRCLCSPEFAARVSDNVTTCDTCPAGADCTVRGTQWHRMSALAGYWEQDKEFYRCLLDTHCPGGVSALQGGASPCAAHRVGPLCAKCAADFTTGTGGECRPCASKAGSWVYVVGAVMIYLLALLINYIIILKAGRSLLFAAKLQAMQEDIRDNRHSTPDDDSMTKSMAKIADELTPPGSRSTTSVVPQSPPGATVTPLARQETHAQISQYDMRLGGEFVAPGDRERIAVLLAGHERRKRVITIYGPPSPQPNFTFKLKIALGFAQIVTNLALGLEIQWPTAFKEFVLAFNIANLDFFQGAATNCVVNTNYFTKVWVFVCVPVAVIMGLGLFFLLPKLILLHYSKGRNAVDKRATSKMQRQKFWRLMVFTLFLIYPSVSSTVIRLYVCKEVRGVRYLRADFSVVCAGDWEWHTMALIPFIFLYPVGIPLFFFAMTFQSWRKGRLEKFSRRAALGFLYDAYHRNVWFWEMLDMLHKLTLTSLIAFIDFRYQMASAMVFVLAYLTAILCFDPYIRKGDDKLHILAQTELVLLLMAGNVFNSRLMPDPVMNAVMTVILIASFILFLVFLVVTSLSAVKKMLLDEEAEQNGCVRFLVRMLVKSKKGRAQLEVARQKKKSGEMKRKNGEEFYDQNFFLDLDADRGKPLPRTEADMNKQAMQFQEGVAAMEAAKDLKPWVPPEKEKRGKRAVLNKAEVVGVAEGVLHKGKESSFLVVRDSNQPLVTLDAHASATNNVLSSEAKLPTVMQQGKKASLWAATHMDDGSDDSELDFNEEEAEEEV